MTERRIRLRSFPVTLTQDRLFERIDQSGGPDACWPWMAGRISTGYGSFYRHGVHILAHRDSYTIANGPIPAGLHVLHRCDNPPCCNPKHLFLGTQATNNADKLAKGRLPHGENHFMTKFTDEQVNGVVALYQKGGISQKAAAATIGMCGPHFCWILSGKVRKIRHGS